MRKRCSTALDSKFKGRPGVPEIPRLQADFAACTIIAKNYLAMARVLAESFQQRNPGCPFFVLLMDPIEGYFPPDKEPFFLLEARQLDIPNLEGFLFKYGILEASTAVKPTFLKKLFREHDVQKLVYLDPDILVLEPLQELSSLLDRHSIVLTPHTTTPYPDDAIPGDHDILRAGGFNLGFVALRNGAVTQSLLDWWERKLYHYGLLDFEKNMFVDQRWMDLAPALFGDVEVLRDPGYNVAYWNLHERQTTIADDKLFVNGGPCYFFHFSGFNPEEPSLVSKHQTRFKMRKLGDLQSLFAKYRQKLLEKGWEETSKWPYTYDFFDNGHPIPAAARRFYWSLGEEVAALGSPFTWINDVAAAVTKAKPEREAGEIPFGINVIGYVASEKGVGEAVRSNIRIVKSTGIPYVSNNFVDTGSRNLEALPGSFSHTNPYKVNLINVNADQMPYFVQRNNGYLMGRYNVGYWAWELPSFPKEWWGSFAYVDEIWVPSKFTRDSVARASSRPVICVPHSIDPDVQPSREWTRERLNISSDTFVYLFLFDFHSFLERKNPVGLITAFKQAFGDRKDVLLLMKSVHADSDPSSLRRLEKVSQGANVRIFDEVLSKQAIHALMQLSDCYVSLHRSEGFGLTLSEAMMCGIPVIATAYSGNMDFMSEENSFLVPYRLVEIDQDHGPYKSGNVWADPDLEKAGDLMMNVFQDRSRSSAIAKRGQTDVMTRLHPSAIGEIVKSRLRELGNLRSDAVSDGISR